MWRQLIGLAFASDSDNCFVKLKYVFDCKRGLAKQMLILKMIGKL